jgi:hypothetical protein
LRGGESELTSHDPQAHRGIIARGRYADRHAKSIVLAIELGEPKRKGRAAMY